MNPTGPAAPRHRRRALHSLCAMLTAVALLAWLDLSGAFDGAHRWFHDLMVRHHVTPAHADVVIVAIDERSISALGRWPWPRQHHAELVQRLSAEAPSAIGLDLLFTEPDLLRPEDDQALAVALARSGLVTLPVMMQMVNGRPVVAQPLAELRRHASSLGHVHLPVDSDGLVRRVYLHEGTEERLWGHFTLAMLQRAGLAASAPRLRAPRGEPVSSPYAGWIRQTPTIISFAGPPGSFRKISYVDVLRGHFPAGSFRNKLVLIGPTAAGLGDLFATPLTREKALMPGVELHANVLNGMMQGRTWVQAPRLVQFIFSLVPVMFALPGAWRFTPRRLLVWYSFMGMASTALAWIAGLNGVQISPVSALLALCVFYLSYVWRQWISTNKILSEEILRFRGHPEFKLRNTHLTAAPSDLVQSRVQTLRHVAQQLRDVHRFVVESLEAVPDATLVCDKDGHVRLANAEAARMARVLAVVDPVPESAVEDRRRRPGDVLRGLPVSRLLEAFDYANMASDTAARQLLQSTRKADNISASTRLGHDYLIKSVPTHSARNEHTGWILSLIDVTTVHEAQRQRDEAIGFMSHDMRAPQTAILSLLELRRKRPDTLSAEQFEERVERHARKALALADGFIQLASAQTKEYRLAEQDLVELARDCMDDFWEQSQQRGILLRYQDDVAQAIARVDREHYGRAVTNLLGNAMKFSPRGSTVLIGVRSSDRHWIVWIRDEGPGISPEAQAHLFKPFFRDPSAHRTDGVGLGLPFVQTVMRRHGGTVRLHSEVGKGSRFELWLPHDASP